MHPTERRISEATAENVQRLNAEIRMCTSVEHIEQMNNQQLNCHNHVVFTCQYKQIRKCFASTANNRITLSILQIYLYSITFSNE